VLVSKGIRRKCKLATHILWYVRESFEKSQTLVSEIKNRASHLDPLLLNVGVLRLEIV
jgi:hypothetical protein